MWKNNGCPCTKDCPDRIPGCHGKCPKYNAWAEKRAAAKKEYAIAKERYAMTDSKSKAMNRYYRFDYSGASKKFSG